MVFDEKAVMLPINKHEHLALQDSSDYDEHIEDFLDQLKPDQSDSDSQVSEGASTSHSQEPKGATATPSHSGYTTPATDQSDEGVDDIIES